MASLRMKKNPANTNGLIVLCVFFVLYMNKIFLIENDISYITENKDFAIIIILHKGLEKSISHPRDENL